MASRLNYLLIFGSAIFACVESTDSSYYEYCRIMDCGERRQECRLLRDENVAFHSKYQAKRQVNPHSSATSNGSGEDNLSTSAELSTYVATSALVTSNQIRMENSGVGQASTASQVAVNITAPAVDTNSTVVNTSTAVNATSSAVNATSPAVNATSPAVNATASDVVVVGNSTGGDVVGGTRTLGGGMPIVGSDVMVIKDAEIKNNSVPAGEERSDVFRRFRDMLNNRPRQNDTLLDEDDHEFDDFFDRFDEIINNNKTLQQNNITKYEEDYHQYYNSSFIVSEAIGQKYWVKMSERENVQKNEVLSNTHRRAVTVRLSFDFPFYGHLIRNVTVATGGFLFTGEYVHSWLAATQYVAPLMANFDTSLSNSSAIKYVDNGTSFTVEWENVILRDEPHFGAFTFQVTLHVSGDVVFVYKNIPVIVENIRDVLHPVKVGLSDAYISDQVIFFIRRKTIYEYHRVEFSKEDIRNWTVIYLSALPTCVSKTNCYECFTQTPGFQCSWCPGIGRCSNGVDRYRKEWLASGCEHSAYQSVQMCPGIQQRLAKQYESGHIPGILAIIFLVAIVGSFCLWMLYAYRNPHTPSGQFLIRYRPNQWRWRRGEARYTAATIHM